MNETNLRTLLAYIQIHHIPRVDAFMDLHRQIDEVLYQPCEHDSCGDCEYADVSDMQEPCVGCAWNYLTGTGNYELHFRKAWA